MIQPIKPQRPDPTIRADGWGHSEMRERGPGAGLLVAVVVLVMVLVMVAFAVYVGTNPPAAVVDDRGQIIVTRYEDQHTTCYRLFRQGELACVHD